MTRSPLEEQFAANWEAWFPEIDLWAELRFTPPRRFRFDFAHPAAKVAVEIQGAIWTGGRHARGSGLLKEHEKLNLAASQGWRVFYLNANTIDDRPIYNQIANAILQS